MSDAVRRVPPLADGEARLVFLQRLGDALRPLADAASVHAVAADMLRDAMQADDAGFSDGTGAIVGDDRTVIVPLLVAWAPRALFFLRFAHPRALDDTETAFLRDAAERAWSAGEAARAGDALRRSEASLAAALEIVPVGIAMLDTEGRILRANSEYRQFLPDGVIPSRDPAGRHRWRAWDENGVPLAVDDYPGARAMRGERTVPGQAMLFSMGGTHEVWTRVASVPIHGEDGRVVGQASVISDIDVLKRGSDALRESRARAQLLIDGIACATWEAAPDGPIEADSPSWRAYTGQSYDEWKGFGWVAAIHPDDRAATEAKWAETVRGQHAVDAEYRLRGRDGGYRWMNVRAVPLRDEAGQIVKWLGMNIDIDDRKRLEQALRSEERRTRALVEGIPQLLWRADRPGEWSWASPQWSAFTGQSAEDGRGSGWLRMVHPDDQDAARAAWTGAEAAGGFEVEQRLRRRDGDYRWFVTRAVPVRDEAGDVVEWLGTANDIDDLRQAQARQDIMVAELQHRTRNLIAVVRALAEKTLDRASSLADFEARFNDRLSSLARVQALLSRVQPGRRVTFDALLRSELRALGAGDDEGLDDRIVLDGPRDVPLRSGAVQTLALALHELATNAVKHGALGTGTGVLKVDWAIESEDGRPVLSVVWTESGVALPAARDGVAAAGYGRELIERALPFQLKAKTGYAFTDDGLRCTIRVPVVATATHEEQT